MNKEQIVDYLVEQSERYLPDYPLETFEYVIEETYKRLAPEYKERAKHALMYILESNTNARCYYE